MLAQVSFRPSPVTGFDVSAPGLSANEHADHIVESPRVSRTVPKLRQRDPDQGIESIRGCLRASRGIDVRDRGDKLGACLPRA